MVVDTVDFRSFRNISDASLSFTPGVNILWGDNAQGKTNALEGIYCFAYGRSFRGVKDKELLKFGASDGELRLSFTDARREQKLSVKLWAEKTRTLTHNGVCVRRTADFVGIFRAVLFCPEHLSLIRGAPALRRSFLDAAISQLRPAYLASLNDYARILKQRNALLKDDSQSEEARTPLYEVLTRQMAEVNTRIVLTRQKYIRLLDESVGQFLSDMTGERERVSLTYLSDSDFEEEDSALLAERFYRKCMSYAGREFAAGTSLHGCHRDDIGVFLGGREARLCASQGQERSIVLAMKLGEGELSRAASGEYPVFLFDDVLSELDRSRQRYLMQRLDSRQVIITSCNEELFRGTDAALIEVRNGVYLQ